MNTPLDQAIVAAGAAEAVYATDQMNVTTIQNNIAAAETPLAPAQAQLASDAAAYNAALDVLVAAATAAKVPTS
jgi:hypothetical protein